MQIPLKMSYPIMKRIETDRTITENRQAQSVVAHDSSKARCDLAK